MTSAPAARAFIFIHGICLFSNEFMNASHFTLMKK